MKFCLILLLLFPLPALSQASSLNESPKSALAGRVVKDPGSLPVKKAEVQLMAESQEAGTNYAATTDGDGHFRIDGIGAGRYRVFVERAGLVEIDKRNRRSPGTALSFEPGKDVDDLVLHMLPAAVVAGRVLDEDSDPMVRTDVSVLRYGYTLGHRQLETAASVTTNDLGEYRIPDLLPGRYLIMVNPTPDLSGLSTSSPQNPGDKQETSYLPTYYPGTTDRSRAAFLELRPGDESSVNFNLIPGTTFHVRGSLSRPDPRAATVLLLRPKESNAEYTAAHVDKDGRFDIGHVPSGSYTLIAVTGNGEAQQVAQQALEVPNRDVNDVRIVSLASSRVHGQLHVAGRQPRDLSSLLVLLESSERDRISSFLGGNDLDGSPTLARVKRDGSFEVKDVPTGTYWVVIEGNTVPDSFLKSVSLGASDVTDSGLSVGGGGTYSIDLLIGVGAGEVDGSVSDGDDHPVADAIVVAVPQPSRRNRLDLFAKGVTDQHGRFSLSGVPPGDYQMLAFESIEEGAYYDPEFLEAFEDRGEKVRLEENGRKTLQLKVIVSSGNEP